MEPVLKTGEVKAFVGSNPTPSACQPTLTNLARPDSPAAKAGVPPRGLVLVPVLGRCDTVG